DCVPDGDVKPAQASLVHRRNLRCRGQACLGSHGIGSDLSTAYPRERVRRLVEHEVDLTRHQVLYCRCGAAIRYEQQLGPDNVLEVDAPYMRCAADTGGSDRNLVLVRLDPG